MSLSNENATSAVALNVTTKVNCQALYTFNQVRVFFLKIGAKFINLEIAFRKCIHRARKHQSLSSDVSGTCVRIYFRPLTQYILVWLFGLRNGISWWD